MTFVQPGRLRAVAELPESKLSTITPGKLARITPAADPQKTYPLTVRRIETLGAAKGEWQSFDVWFDLSESAGQLLPGFRGSIVVPGEKVDDVLIVPVSAVAKNRVWVHSDDGKDEARDVTIGRSDGQNVEIKAGLKEGDKVLKQAKK
jgi:multidrug efflux pump subunit AcrA (membrane-fusion protein)